MKLVLAIVQDADSDDLIDEITKEGYRVTKVISTGGFLKSGNSTIMIGTDDSEVHRHRTDFSQLQSKGDYKVYSTYEYARHKHSDPTY